MRALITGGKGRLGRALREQLLEIGAEICVSESDRLGYQPDVTQLNAFRDLAFQVQPSILLHCAAWTDVDGCAREPERAERVNATGTRNAATVAACLQIPIVYVSSNEVFSGQLGDAPFHEYDRAQPANHYGRSKWLGEEAVRAIWPRHYIVRTSWLYARGGHNFTQVMLAAARAGTPLRVVTDEVATPTATEELAAAIIALIQTEAYGNYHLVNEGSCSRFEFARFILGESGLGEITIEPILRADWPRDSTPPAFSVLANHAAKVLGIELRPWQEALVDFLQQEELSAG